MDAKIIYQWCPVFTGKVKPLGPQVELSLSPPTDWVYRCFYSFEKNLTHLVTTRGKKNKSSPARLKTSDAIAVIKCCYDFMLYLSEFENLYLREPFTAFKMWYSIVSKEKSRAAKTMFLETDFYNRQSHS